MSIIKRLSTTLVGSIDQLVADIENHDAIIQASLADMHKKIATARVRLAQIQKAQQQLQTQTATLQEQASRWQSRAIDCAKTDEAKALACLRHRQQCLQRAEQLEQERVQYAQACHSLAQEIDASEQQLQTMQHKQRLLRARQSSSNAAQAVSCHLTSQDTINDTFERWEIRIAQNSTLMHPAPMVDPLETEFRDKEEDASLKAELALLMAGTAKHKENENEQ